MGDWKLPTGVTFGLAAILGVMFFGAAECARIESKRFEACVQKHGPLECTAAYAQH